MTINDRIARLTEQLAKENTGKILVVFADGRKGYMDAGACIDLISTTNIDQIGRFEGGGKGNGLLLDLLNGILET